MKRFDAVVIGGGILGCFVARNLRRWNISTLLVEKEGDVCTGITRANSAIVYAGYDNKPGSSKAEMTVRGNANMDSLCEELEVPFSRCGSLLVTYDVSSVPKLERKLENGRQNGVAGMRMLTGEEAEAMEPMLKKGIAAAVYAPSTGTVNPWQLGIAAYENAVQNGAQVSLNTSVNGIRREDSGYILLTSGESIACKVVINCAGLYADQLQQLLFPPSTRLKLDGAEYLVLDPLARKPEHIIFHQADSCGKGITAIPCVEGNLLISGVRKDLTVPFATTAEGLEELYADTHRLLPELDTSMVIRSFGAVRPNPYRESGESIPDFCVENPAPGFYSLIGIKTPGLTCSNELGLALGEKAAAFLQAEKNICFNPHRKAIEKKKEDPDYCQILCQCERITKGEIMEAIRRGATTVDGVKRRVGSGMGRCQGSRCTWEIEKLLEENGHGAI
ncbi:MAG: NAD(P)/FAD-dependent oxidoreductase [Oscillospiraceae bacterium]|nr:NAD(P)/FAD-dependent oxidoreductase [Oscillospiraceae bacterium]